MRKVLAIFLIVTVFAVFASCDSNTDNETTTAMSTTASTTAPTTTEPEPMSYVLTTNPEKTIPYVETTRFEFSGSVSTPSGNINIDVPSGGTVDKPQVNTGVAPTPQTTLTTTTTTKATTTTTTTTKATTTTTTTTEAPVKKPVHLVINSEAVGNEQIILEIDGSAWTGDIKANTQNIAVKVDGIPLEGTVPLKVASGKNADGNQEVILDLTGKGVGSDTTVTFTIPEGFLQTSNGAQYNTSYSASASY